MKTLLALIAEAPEKLQFILDSLGDGVTVQDASGRLIYANPHAARVLGFDSPGELLDAGGSSARERFELLDESGKPLTGTREPTELARGGQASGWTLMHFRVRSTGEERWSMLQATPLLDAHGKVERVLNVWHDVTEQRRAEIGARFLADASILLASATPDYAATLSAVAKLAVPRFADWCAVDLVEGEKFRRVEVAHVNPEKIRFAMEIEQRYPAPMDENNALVRIVRTGKGEMMSEIPEALLVQSARDPEHLRLIRELALASYVAVPMAARGKILGVMTFVWAESKRRYTQADLKLAEDLGRRAGMAVDNARLFEEVRALNETLDRRVAERTAALEDANRELESFSYSVSHDLRAPLRHVNGFVELLEKHATGKLDERSAHYLQTIREAATRAGQLVDDLLSFSRMGRSAMRSDPVKMETLAKEVWTELEPERGDREIAWELGPLPPAQGDPALLRLVLYNLLSNAVKFTSKQPSARIELGAVEKDGQTVYTVRDDGAGFDPAYMDKLFGVFQRLHSAEEFEGTGIGLATVKRIIARHGGRIWAEAEPGRGAAFHFTLPQAQEGTP